MINTIVAVFFLALVLLCSPLTYASETGLPLPRFASLAADEVNLRTGPGQRYPIVWIYKKKGLPVEIMNEFDTWRKIRDVTGDEGWVHQSMLSGRRYGIIRETIAYLHTKPLLDSVPVVRLEPGVMVRMPECLKDWCRLRLDTFEGWAKKVNLWGVYNDEKFE